MKTNDDLGNRRGGTSTILIVLLVLSILLVLPGLALHRLQWDWRWMVGYFVVINLLTYRVYANDKRRAIDGEWRISEANLHLLELLGGWPAALLAQRRLRHKCSKGSYLFVFWLIVLGYQVAAYDSFQDWKFSRIGLEWMQNQPRHRR